MRIVFVVNDIGFLLSHRVEICIAAIDRGYEVHVVAPYKQKHVLKLAEMSISFHSLSLSRVNFNPLQEFKLVFSLIEVFRNIKPDIVHLITVKPYLYGGIAARLAKTPAVVSAVSGLGILFSSKDFKYKLMRLGVYPLYKLAFGHKNQVVIFQNSSDREILLEWGVIKKSQVRMIRGSGVNLSHYPMLNEPINKTPVIAFAARLLKDKGVEVFVQASRLLKNRNLDANFWLIGSPDPGNDNSVTQEQLARWECEGLVKLFGFRQDVAYLFGKSNIVTLPSFYGEGLPKVLIEAAACGRAVVTTDHPGCRDAIRPGTGILVPVKDPASLADAIQDLIQHPEKRHNMGRLGRVMAEKEFSVDKVVATHIEIYQDLLKERDS